MRRGADAWLTVWSENLKKAYVLCVKPYVKQHMRGGGGRRWRGAGGEGAAEVRGSKVRSRAGGGVVERCAVRSVR